MTLILAPLIRMMDQGSDWLAALKPNSPPFFYFKYRGRAFPDSLQRLMTAVGGRTFQFLSPPEFDQAIRKLLGQLRQQ